MIGGAELELLWLGWLGKLTLGRTSASGGVWVEQYAIFCTITGASSPLSPKKFKNK